MIIVTQRIRKIKMFALRAAGLKKSESRPKENKATLVLAFFTSYIMMIFFAGAMIRKNVRRIST